MNSISQVFAIGDIHGCNGLLKKIHKKIINKSEKAMGNKILIYLGDYIDRGSKVKETIDTIINFRPKSFKCVFLRGNHDQMLLDFVNNKRNSLGTWLYNDGVAKKSSGAGDWASTSDERLKKNINDLSVDALAVLNSLRPIEFKWKEEELHKTPKDSDGNTYGFLADEIKSVMPQLVTEGELPKDSADREYVDEDGIAKSTELGHMASLYIKAIQQLTTRLEALENA